MIKLKKQNKRAEEEKAAKEEEDPNQAQEKKQKKPPGELRLMKEINELDLPAHAQVVFNKDGSIMSFNVDINLKNEDCLWKGGRYLFSMEISPNYPHDAPKVKCQTQIYHPNIDLLGNVCLNILRDDWKPVLGINAVILGLIFLFIEPNPNDPLNHEAAALMRDNPAKFKQNVKKTLQGGTFEGHTYEKFIY